MQRRLHVTAALLVALLVSGCASSTARSASQTTTPVDVTGQWYGYRSFGGGLGTEISFDLRQTGNAVTGAAMWGRSPSGQGGTGGPVEGKVTGNRLEFAVPAERFTGETVVRGDEMSGSLDGPYNYRITLKRKR